MTVTEQPGVDRGHEGVGPALSLVAAPSVNLRLRLFVFDTAAMVLAWVPVLFLGGTEWARTTLDSAALAAAAVTLGMWLLHMNELYLARVAAVRSIELSRLLRVAVLEVGGMLVVLRVYDSGTRIREVVLGSILMLGLLVIARSAYRAWIAAGRRSGRFVRDVLLVGTNKEAAELAELFNDHPETGFRIAGVVGDRLEALAHDLIDLWKGEAADAPAILRGTSVNGVVIVVGALETEELNELVRELQARKVHMHLSNGVRGINYRRLRAAPIAHEPLFYVEQPELRRHQRAAKRVMDVAIAGLMTVLLAPFLGVIALLIKLGDRGPVFFQQVRVGQNGEEFKVLKFRTMVVDAESKLLELQQTNERHGPLFKMDRDPRITRVGRILRETSLDELPQLINVLRGEMSLVGPRPALPSEVAQFDQRLLERTKVPPGITGLWQSEARDNPSFAAYRRLDLFYVDNWSVALDLVIMLATAEQVLAKALRGLRRSSAATTERQPEQITTVHRAA
jgi:exopolysaccharide biosynthesis polyprenyl glycosylphosphotransferase